MMGLSLAAAHVFDDLDWCTGCWRTRQNLVDQHILVCEPANVVPLEHQRARKQANELGAAVMALLGEMGFSGV